jgi:hypothetical protein
LASASPFARSTARRLIDAIARIDLGIVIGEAAAGAQNSWCSMVADMLETLICYRLIDPGGRAVKKCIQLITR